MGARASNSSHTNGLRSGTALRRSGKETSARIIEAAREQLSEQGQGKFSLRNIAERAGITLANLQYYYPRRDDLIQALFVDLSQRYQHSYQAATAEVEDDPQQRFDAVLRYNLQDVTDPQTRRFFIQLWSLLISNDAGSDQLLFELYDIDIEQLSEFIAALDSKATASEVECRAVMLASFLEGMMIVLGSRRAGGVKMKRLLDRAYRQGMAIAKGIC